MSKPPVKISFVKNVTAYSTYIIVIWCFYRFLFQFPDQIEESIIKPIVWLLPIFYVVFQKEHLNLASLGFTFKNLLPAICFSIGLGAVFIIEGLLTNFLKYGNFSFAANIGGLPLMTSLGISFATAFSEETAFRGYIFNRLWFVMKREWSANVLTTILWTAIHVPIAFFVWKLDVSAGLIYLGLTAIFGLGSAFVFARTKNVWGSILLHIFWEWPIILFR
jgi:membrane protease YdiL (CAAX protease family)